jgi:phospholipid/cholesterol/gamma-HCH transport system substrate-binding protein
MKERSLRAVATLRLLGVAFLSLCLLFGWATYAIFTKKFVDYVPVTVTTSKIGLQLPMLADVKVRGLIVGDVRHIALDQGQARLELALDPAKVRLIPANVTAMILPKTLFGEKYVELVVPEDPAPEHVRAGSLISQSEVAIEVERVLSDLYPLLRTVQPAELNYTLTALANALEGRGERLGENLAVLDGYLRRTNPQLPLLVDDVRKLGRVSDLYRAVAPELAEVLRNQVVTGRTFVEKSAEIRSFFTDVTGFASTSRDFLEQNGQNIIRLGEQGQAQLPLFAKYAPEYPCLFDGLVGAIPREAEAFRGYTLHINLETLKRQPRGYTVNDRPEYDEHRGPADVADCRDTLADKYGQDNLPPDRLVPELNDGVDYPLGKRAPTGFDMTSGYAGTRAEQTVVDSIAARVLGVSLDRVPDVAALLVGPLVRGSEVSLR